MPHILALSTAVAPGATWLQSLAWLAGTLGAVVALFKFLAELRESRRQRERDLRWRQAEAGKRLNDEMQADPSAAAAMFMLDYETRSFEMRPGVRVAVTRADISAALRSGAREDGENLERYTYIRDCFDTLFYFFAAFEHHIENTLVRSDDVAFPLEYYVPLLCALKDDVQYYLQQYSLMRAERFLSRYSVWRSAVAPAEIRGCG